MDKTQQGNSSSNKIQEKRDDSLSTSLLEPLEHKIEDKIHELAEKDADFLTHSDARYLGYTAAISRGFRYLAFSSDFGEALRPISSARFVTGTYAVAIGYCFVDVAWEAVKLHERNYVHEKTKQPMTMAQLVVERSIFHGIASIAAPFAVIHSGVAISRKLFGKLNRFQKFGPSVVGLALIPLLPTFLDEPIEHGLEWVFHHYGPWASKPHSE